jgi:hypothetical protein
VSVQHGRLGRPPNDDHGRCFVGLDQLDRDRRSAVELSAGQLATLDMEILLPVTSGWISA